MTTTGERFPDVPTAGTLKAALASATPGTTIRLAPVTYRGRFTPTRSGTASAAVRTTDNVLSGSDLHGADRLSVRCAHRDGAVRLELRAVVNRGFPGPLGP